VISGAVGVSFGNIQVARDRGITMGILKYKEYEGIAEFDIDHGVYRGKVLFIDDLVTYEADSRRELQREFEAAVDDYIATCATLGKEPQ
jgi:predicted HicB family RNase H-like nuclease